MSKKKIIQDFKDLILQIDHSLYSDDINNQLMDIIKRVRKLYPTDRSD